MRTTRHGILQVLSETFKYFHFIADLLPVSFSILSLASLLRPFLHARAQEPYLSFELTFLSLLYLVRFNVFFYY